MNYKGFKIVGLAVMILILFFSWSRAETLVTNEENTPSINGYFNQIDYQSSQQLYSLTQSDSASKPKPNIDVYHFKGKSTKRGFLYSLILPGAGEFYAGSKIKAVLFVGLEAAFWTGYFTNHKKGKNKEDEFIDWANKYWSIYAYSESLVTRYDGKSVPGELEYPGFKYDNTPGFEGIVIDKEGAYYNSKNLKDSIVISHSLHPQAGQPIEKDQQYYETIGKWEQTSFGWDDYNGDTSVYGGIYIDMRYVSNSFLKKANRYVMVSLANHLLSAFDAALAVRSHNRKGEKFSTIDVKLRLAEYNKNEVIPKLTVSTKF